MPSKVPRKPGVPEKLASLVFLLAGWLSGSRRSVKRDFHDQRDLPTPYPPYGENHQTGERENVSQIFFGIIEIIYQYIISVRNSIFYFFRSFKMVGAFFQKIGAVLANRFFAVVEQIYFTIALPVNDAFMNALFSLMNMSRGKKIYLGLLILIFILLQSVFMGNPKVALIMGLIPFVLLLVFFNPVLGFCFYLLFGLGMLQYMVYGFPRMRLGTPLLLMTMASYGVYILTGKEKNFNIVYDNQFAIMCAIWTVMALANFLVYSGRIWGFLILVSWFVVATTCATIIGTSKQRFFLVYATICFIYFLYAYQTIRNAFYYGLDTTYTVTAEVRGTLSDNNELSAVLNMTVPLVVGLIIINKQWLYRLPLIGALMFFLLAIVYANSRGGLVGLSAVSLPIVFMLVLKNSKYKTLALGVIFVLLVGSGILVKDKVLSRFQSIEGWKTDASAHNRILGTILGYRVMKRHLLFGSGPESLYRAFHDKTLLQNKTIFKYWFGEDDYIVIRRPHEVLVVHNAYFSCAGENGFFVTFLWVWLLLYHIYRMRRLRKELRGNEEMEWASVISTSLEITMYSYMITGWFLNNYYSGYTYLVIALGVSLDMIAKQKKPRSNPVYVVWLGILFTHWLVFTFGYRYFQNIFL
ncbi:MAG: O-antigen ligase family protein [bacterium]